MAETAICSFPLYFFWKLSVQPGDRIHQQSNLRLNDLGACGRKLGAILWLSLMLVVSAVYGLAADRHVLFLVDSSGSMKQNDPRRLTAAACATAAHLLDENDQVALWEFDASARPLHPGWLRAGDWDAWLAAVKRISQRGQFTDICAAVAGAAQHFTTHPASGRRVLILLTDGLFEPDLMGDGYAPQSLE